MKKLLFGLLALVSSTAWADTRWTTPFVLIQSSNTWYWSQVYNSSVTFKDNTMGINGVEYNWPTSATNNNCLKYNNGDLSWASCGGGAGGGGGGSGFYFNGSEALAVSTFTIPGFPISYDNGFATITVIAASPTWTGSHTFRSSTTFLSPISSLTVAGNFVAIGSMTARGVITSTAGFIGGRSTFSSIAVGVDDLSFGGIFNALDPTTGISFNGNVVSMYTQGGNAGTYGTEHLAIPKLQFTTSGGGQSEPVLKLSSLDSTHGLFSNYTGLTLNHWGLSHNGNEVIRVQNDTGKIAFGRIKPIADVTISTGYLSGPGPILGVYNGSPRFEVNRSSVVVYSSMTVRDIIISTTGALLGGATIQGRFAVVGGSLVLNNSLLVFGPVAPSNGQVPKYNGTNGLIEWSADNTGAGGNGPITAAEWNAHTSTDSHIEILRLQQSTDTLVYNGGINLTAFAQGSNVTLTQSGSTLTIAASGVGGSGGTSPALEIMQGPVKISSPVSTVVFDSSTFRVHGNINNGSTVTVSLSSAVILRSHNVTFSGGGSAITAGATSYFTVPYNAVIASYTLVADQGGQMRVNIRKNDFGAFSGDNSSICGANCPSISGSNRKNNNSILTGWNRDVKMWDTFEVFLDTNATTVTQAQMTLFMYVKE